MLQYSTVLVSVTAHADCSKGSRSRQHLGFVSETVGKPDSLFTDFGQTVYQAMFNQCSLIIKIPVKCLLLKTLKSN